MADAKWAPNEGNEDLSDYWGTLEAGMRKLEHERDGYKAIANEAAQVRELEHGDGVLWLSAQMRIYGLK